MFWAIWYYPYVIYFNYVPEFSPVVNIGLEIYGLLGFTAVILGGSVIFSWIYANTESLLILILYRAFQNIFPVFVVGQVIDMGSGTVIIALFIWIVVVLITKKYGSETQTGLTGVEKAAKEAKHNKKNKGNSYINHYCCLGFF